MNQIVRNFLIDQCVKGQPIYYEAVGTVLGLNLNNESDRHILSKTLGDISAYEYQNGRPLISSIAIYKTKNDHGYGFYDLCEKLGIGKAAKLQDTLYGFTEIERSKSYWQNSLNYSHFYNISSKIYDETNSPPFFNEAEIDFFRTWSNQTYDPKNSDHVNAKNYLLDSVWAKTKFWSNEVVSRLPGFETSNKRAWSKRGWDSGVQVSSFKPYTWARIFRKGDRSKDIFFTIGVDSGEDALIYKLDYFRESETRLTQEQKALCESYIPKELMWNEIPEDDLPFYNWEKLIQHTVDFISKNAHHYDQVEKLVWGTDKPNEVFFNSLTPRDYPSGGLTTAPAFNPSFTGHKTDFIKLNIENKELGDAGEELVKEYEVNKLKERGEHDLANKVRVADDGEGFDVYSFDENNNERFIEVKTTEGNEKTPFHLSINEYIFCEKNKDKYCIYRLYNYKYDNNHADYFVIKDPLNSLIFVPTEYKVYLKKIQ